jgi:hypothetical protein
MRKINLAVNWLVNRLKSRWSMVAAFAIAEASLVVMLVANVLALNYLFWVGVGISIFAIPLTLLAVGLDHFKND